ncbi:MAG: LysM peptidoglycan-binding domain-containing protein [Bacteroidota bacterium]
MWILVHGSFCPELIGQEYLLSKAVNDHQARTSITMSPGYTLYTIGRVMGVSVEDLMMTNPQLDPTSIDVNARLTIPILADRLATSPDSMTQPIPVFHQVQKGENWYRIAKVFYKSEITHLQGLNPSSSTLSIDDRVLLGYIDWPYDLDQFRTDTISTLEVDPSAVDTLRDVSFQLEEISIRRLGPDSILTDTRLTTSKGIALIEQRNGGTDELVVIHRNAAVDTEIEIYNPMMRRRVLATVVAQLPEAQYADDVSLVMSPAVASALGALDKRVLVEMTYIPVP